MTRAILLALTCASFACATELRGSDAVEACTDINTTFCEALNDCDGSVALQPCLDASDGLGGPCESATLVVLPADVATCQDDIKHLECRAFDDRTNLDLPCPTEIRFE